MQTVGCGCHTERKLTQKQKRFHLLQGFISGFKQNSVSAWYGNKMILYFYSFKVRPLPIDVNTLINLDRKRRHEQNMFFQKGAKEE